MDAVLMSRVVPAAVAMVCAVVTAWSWRRSRRVSGAVFATVGVVSGLVAIRHLPEPVIVAVLLAFLGLVAVVTAWPLVVRPRPGRRADHVGRTGRGVS